MGACAAAVVLEKAQALRGSAMGLPCLCKDMFKSNFVCVIVERKKQTINKI